jgi:hypothetical protein
LQSFYPPSFVVRVARSASGGRSAFHEPDPLIPSFSPSGGEGARRAVEGDHDQFMAWIRVQFLRLSSHEPNGRSRSLHSRVRSDRTFRRAATELGKDTSCRSIRMPNLVRHTPLVNQTQQNVQSGLNEIIHFRKNARSLRAEIEKSFRAARHRPGINIEHPPYNSRTTCLNPGQLITAQRELRPTEVGGSCEGRSVRRSFVKCYS